MKRSINSAISTVFSIKTKNESETDYYRSALIIQEVTQFRGIELDNFCHRVFNHPKLPNGIKFIYKDLSKFCAFPNIRFYDSNSELTWLSHLFKYNSELLTYFSSAKKRIESLILTSNYEEALRELDKLHDNCGYSFWEIEMRSCLEKHVKNTSNQKYISNIRNAIKHKVEDFFLQQILFKHQSKRFETFSKNLVGILDEMRDSQGDAIATHYADVYSSYFLPIEFDKRISVDERRLYPSTHISCIDQYLLFKKYFNDKIAHGSGLNKREFTILKGVTDATNDTELENLINVHNKEERSVNETISLCIKKYTEGNYSPVKETISKLISEDVRYTSLIEILSRSEIYINSQRDPDSSLLDNIVNSFKSVLLSKPDSVTQRLYLESVATTFNHSSICSSVLFHLYNTIKNNEYKRDVARRNCLIQSDFCTPYISGINKKNLESYENVPNYRKIKHRDLSSLSDKEIEEHFKSYQKECLIKSDYIRDYSNYLIETNKLLQCAEFTVNTFISNNLTHPFLPINELVELIVENGIDEQSIDIPILYSIYSKTISKDKDEDKIEAYEDYICESGTHLPSILFPDPVNFDAKVAYFLKHVCIISNMDSSEEFESTEDIKKERVVILDLLRNSKFNDEIILSERNSILDELSFDGLKTKFDTSKIFVDVDAIKNEKFERYKFLYELYQDAITTEPSISLEDEYTVIDDYNNEKTVVPSSNKTDVLSQIYREIVNDFVCNENYGLDKYLSADIRHGIFVSQIRSGIEKHGIITDVDEHDNYEKNTIMDEKYPLLRSNIKNKIVEDMCEFSKNFDTVLNSANSIFNVVIEINDSSSSGKFNFRPTIDNVHGLRDAIENKNNFEDFFDSIINYMWKLTIDALNEVKKYINENLKVELTETVNNLESSFINHKKTVPLKELSECITHMKASVVEELDRVTSWLNVAEMNESNIYDVRSVVYACKTTFESIFSQYQINLNLDNYTKNIAFTYKDAKPLMTSIITALDNANSHGNGEVSLSIDENQETTSITITNPFKFDSYQDIINLRTLIKQKMSDTDPTLAKIEGGTGVYKIYNLLKNCSNRFNLDYNITDDGYFSLTIGVKDENINH
ncbi:hypothetical protein HJZ14_08490 [Vibrio parahaemolyticus]|nr:hypothetical protein [Vibrio parahaemolyticus]MBE4502508.1 hypothetical protein [Vibrio parahaemolyticus]MBE4505254.1 hypothetical protein [Vibrio parahaemolyticus]